MQKETRTLISCFIVILLFFFLQKQSEAQKIRNYADTVGFAQYGWQMDSVMMRITRLAGDKIGRKQKKAGIDPETCWKLAISPHDDYTYAGYMYPLVLSKFCAKTIIIFGVAHKAKGVVENKLVFDKFQSWKAPYGNVKVSPLREQIIAALPKDTYIIHDSLQQVEHSVEAEVGFLQYFKRDVEIVSILVPYMPFDTANHYAEKLAAAIQQAMKANKYKWGRDVALLVSNDAVHYGDEDWGGKNYAQFGADSAGYRKAAAQEFRIIGECLEGNLDPAKIRAFCNYTVKKEDFRDYKWTWCGRYSVPMGLLTAFYLQGLTKSDPLEGIFLDYSTSIDHPAIPVKDLRMGVTAPAKLHHWVGYLSMGYR